LLSLVDDIFESFRQSGSDAVAETVFVFDCYVGEVLARNAGYEWVDSPTELVRNLGVASGIRCKSAR
jgi:hypothetical protein